MNQTQKKEVNKIISDKTSGSSELLSKINQLLLKTLPDKKIVNEIIKEFSKKLNHFTALENYFKKLKTLLDKNDTKQLENFFLSYLNERDKFKSISDKLKKKIAKFKRIATISRSGTFLNVISLADPKRR
jgi:hypothetical protein